MSSGPEVGTFASIAHAPLRWRVSTLFRRITDDNTMESAPYVSFRSYSLYRNDVKTLWPGSWLNDNVIGIILEVLAYEEFPSLCADDGINWCLMAPGAVAMTLYEQGEDLIDALASLRLQTKDYVAIPVNDSESTTTPNSGTHWSLLIWSKRHQQFFHYDSSPPHNTRAATRISRCLWPAISRNQFSKSKKLGALPDVIAAKCPRQSNDSDCGVYLLLILNTLLRAGGICDIEPIVTPAAVTAYRRHCGETIERLRQEWLDKTGMAYREGRLGEGGGLGSTGAALSLGAPAAPAAVAPSAVAASAVAPTALTIPPASPWASAAASPRSSSPSISGSAAAAAAAASGRAAGGGGGGNSGAPLSPVLVATPRTPAALQINTSGTPSATAAAASPSATVTSPRAGSASRRAGPYSTAASERAEAEAAAAAAAAARGIRLPHRHRVVPIDPVDAVIVPDVLEQVYNTPVYRPGSPQKQRLQ